MGSELEGTSLEEDRTVLFSLRKRCLKLALFYGFFLLCGISLLHTLCVPGLAMRWAALVMPVFLYQMWFLWKNLELNHRPGERVLLPTLGIGNGLSLLRGLCICLLAGYLFSSRPPGILAWVPAILYTVSLLSDWFDGYLARVTNQVTLLGEALDTEFDCVEMLIAVGLVVWYRTLAWWFLFLGLAPYILIFSLWLLRWLGRPVYDLPSWIHTPFGLGSRQFGRPLYDIPRGDRRWPIASMTRAYISVMLWPIVAPPMTTLAGLVFAFPFTVRWIHYWLIVSGTVDLRSSRYTFLCRAFMVLFTRWLPLLLRGILVWTVFPPTLMRFQDYQGQVAYYAAMGFPFPSLTVILFAAVGLVGSVLIGLGIAGRFAAFAVLLPTLFTILAGGLSSELAVVLVVVLSILILDTGDFSLWQPRDRIFERRAEE